MSGITDTNLQARIDNSVSSEINNFEGEYFTRTGSLVRMHKTLYPGVFSGRLVKESELDLQITGLWDSEGDCVELSCEPPHVLSPPEVIEKYQQKILNKYQWDLVEWNKPKDRR
jgi:hypothetical protein